MYYKIVCHYRREWKKEYFHGSPVRQFESMSISMLSISISICISSIYLVYRNDKDKSCKNNIIPKATTRKNDI